MLLHQAQKEIAKDRHRFRVLRCGRQFGKTTLAIEEIKGKALARNDSRIAYIAPTYQQARDIAWLELKRVLAPIIVEVNESRLELTTRTIHNGTASIALRGWESVETLRGQQFDMLVIDEIAMMKHWEEKWQEVLRPTLTKREGEVLFISTPKGFNHFFDICKKAETDTDYKEFHFTSYDNPHLPKGDIDKAKQEMNEDAFAQEYGAEFRHAFGMGFFEVDIVKYYREKAKEPIKTGHLSMDGGWE